MVDAVLPTVVVDAHLVVTNSRRRFAVPGLQKGVTLRIEDADEPLTVGAGQHVGRDQDRRVVGGVAAPRGDALQRCRGHAGLQADGGHMLIGSDDDDPWRALVP